jgi:hypothetical protein
VGGFSKSVMFVNFNNAISGGKFAENFSTKYPDDKSFFSAPQNRIGEKEKKKRIV